MKIRFRRFETEDVDAIARLNERLAAAELPHVVGRETAQTPHELPISERMFVAADGDEIRGAVWLREQEFATHAETLRAGWMIYPVSESLFDARFAGVPGTLLLGLMREQPRLMALGMGGQGGPFAKLLAAARWQSQNLPFFFRLVRPARVLRRLSVARATALRRILGGALAASGLAWVGNGLATGLSRLAGDATGPAALVQEAADFGDWAEALWRAHRARYGFVAVRDARLLGSLYPADFRPLTRLRVSRAGQDLGWVCAQVLDAEGTWLEPQFGDLRVGILTDAFAHPSDAAVVLDAGSRRLAQAGADLVVTNQMHRSWRQAARSTGFWAGPSTLTFSWSPAAGKVIGELEEVHMTRSDGDGPQGYGEAR